jgi:hypothetical protein
LNSLVGGDHFNFIIPGELDVVFEGLIIQNDPFSAEVKTEVEGRDGVHSVLYENITAIVNRVASQLTWTFSNMSNHSARLAPVDLNQVVDLVDDNISEAENDDAESLPDIVSLASIEFFSR